MENNKEKYVKTLLETPEGIKILSDKLETIVSDKDFYKLGLLNDIVSILIENGYEKTIIDKFSFLINNSLSDETLDIIIQVASLSGGQEAISKNIKKVYSKLDGEEIPEVIELLESAEQNKIKVRNTFAYKLHKEGLIGESSLGSIIKSDMSIFVEEVAKEVSEGHELKKLDSGTFSDCISTNGYVIKIGETREKYEIPYHPNILQPLLRERVTDDRGRTILVVEVQNEVDTKNVTNKQRKKLKKILETAKIKCFDNCGDNVGILKKPNKRVLFNGVGGIIDHGDIKEKTLEAGEPVILDTDLIEK